MTAPVVLAMTGASGAPYAVRLLQVLLGSGHSVYLTISSAAQQVLQQELGITVKLAGFDPEPLLSVALFESQPPSYRGEITQHLSYFDHRDLLAPIASGSALTSAMVICPCSGTTLSAVAHGTSNNLIQRAAEVHLKERRKLILVPRETPVSLPYLHNLTRAAEAGAVVLPAMPGWYHGVAGLTDLVDFVVARVLDQVGVEHQLIRRWGEGRRDG